ncbi:DUF4340 domain-containing protein [Rickettsiales bacterium]|nr:DUF4340 domain-containing protein [Rickettsiales bacterium]
MNQKYQLRLFIIAIIFGLLSLVIVSNYNYLAKEEDSGKIFNERLAKNIKDASGIKISHKGKGFSIKIENGVWVLPAKYNYPVKADKVHNLILRASQLVILEKKTADPSRFEDLDLGDSNSDKSESITVHITAEDGKITLADFIVGKLRKGAGGNKIDSSFYARHSGKNQTWLVKGNLDVDLDADALLDTKFIRIANHRVKSADINIVSGRKAVKISRQEASENDFKLNNIGKNEINSQTAINNIAYIPARLSFKDIIPEEDFKAKKISVATYKTFDGLRLEISNYKKKDKYWVKIKAYADKESSNEVKEEVVKINKLVNKWVYQIDDNIGKELAPERKYLIK